MSQVRGGERLGAVEVEVVARGARCAARSATRRRASDGVRSTVPTPSSGATSSALASEKDQLKRRARASGSTARYSSSAAPARRITILSSSIVTSTGRWPAQCSAYTGLSTTPGSSQSP